jgi:hypothetical protein
MRPPTIAHAPPPLYGDMKTIKDQNDMFVRLSYKPYFFYQLTIFFFHRVSLIIQLTCWL